MKKITMLVVMAVALSLGSVGIASAEDITLPKVIVKTYAADLGDATNIVDPAVLRATAVKFEQAALILLQVGEIYRQQLEYSDDSSAGMTKVTKNIAKVTALQLKFDEAAAANILEARTPLNRVTPPVQSKKNWWE